LALTLAGARRGDARAVLIGTAFSSMAALLSIHGLTTPGFLVGDNGLVAFSGALTLPVGGAVLALSTIPELRRPSAVRPVLALQGGLLALIVGLGLAGMLEPSFIPAVPEAASTAAYSVLVAGMIFYGASRFGPAARTCSRGDWPTWPSYTGWSCWPWRSSPACCCTTTSSAGGSAMLGS